MDLGTVERLQPAASGEDGPVVVVVAVKVKVIVECKKFFRDDKISDKFALVDRVGEQHRQQGDAQPAGREPQLRQPCLGYI